MATPPAPGPSASGNLFNSNQFTSVDTGARFNFQTGEQLDAGFGTVTNTRNNSSRVIQLGLRFTF